MDFLCGNHKDLEKVSKTFVSDFISLDFKNLLANMDFPMDFCCFKSVSTMFRSKFLLILNFTNPFIKEDFRKHIYIIRWCLVCTKKSIG